MEEIKFTATRNSRMTLGEVYFWTDTIKDWKCLLESEKYKKLLIEQLLWLKDRNKIIIYAYVIMPNHFHVVWEMVEMNGKEMPHASFNKWTSSNFLKDLRNDDPLIVSHFIERTTARNHRFWQSDPLAILMDSREKVEQKIDYIHLNPLQEHWNLAKEPEEYRWSSAEFYMNGKDEFGILTHYMDRF